MTTKNKIKFLKEELKKISETHKTNKVNSRFNQSIYDKELRNPIIKAIDSGEIQKHGYSWLVYNIESYRNRDLYKELHAKLVEKQKPVEHIDLGFKYYYCDIKKVLTAAYILYNRLRNKGSHIKNEEKENEYNYYITKWTERLDSIEKEEENVDISTTTSA